MVPMGCIHSSDSIETGNSNDTEWGSKTDENDGRANSGIRWPMIVLVQDGCGRWS